MIDTIQMNASGGFVLLAVLAAFVAGFWLRGWLMKRNPAALEAALAKLRELDDKRRG